MIILYQSMCNKMSFLFIKEINSLITTQINLYIFHNVIVHCVELHCCKRVLRCLVSLLCGRCRTRRSAAPEEEPQEVRPLVSHLVMLLAYIRPSSTNAACLWVSPAQHNVPFISLLFLIFSHLALIPCTCRGWNRKIYTSGFNAKLCPDKLNRLLIQQNCMFSYLI